MAATAHAPGCLVAPFPIDSPLTPFFLRRKEEASEGGGGAGGGGSFGGVGGLIYHKELDAAQVEEGEEFVCPTGAVFPGLAEEQ